MKTYKNIHSDYISFLIKEMNNQFVEENNKDVYINEFSPIDNFKNGCLSFANEKVKIDLINSTGIILASRMHIIEESNIKIIVVKDPRLVFIRLLKFFFPIKRPIFYKDIFPSEKILIGNNVLIMPNVVIAENTKIGDNVIIYPNVVIYENVEIKANSIIHSSSVIGNDGFGYQINEMSEYESFPHYAGVIIEENVEIGACSTINSGSLRPTIIKKGTKIDDNCYIAHNVIIGQNCILTAGVKILGSLICEDNVWFGPGAVTKNKIKISSGAVVGMGAVVINDVLANTTVIGNPARVLEKK